MHDSMPNAGHPRDLRRRRRVVAGVRRRNQMDFTLEGNSMTFRKRVAVVVGLGAVVATFSPSWADAPIIDSYFEQRLSAWYWRHQLWAALHFLLGGCSILFSVAAVSNQVRNVSAKRYCGLAAALCAALLTFVNPTAYARAYHEAWIGLDNAKSQLLSGASNDRSLLSNAIRDGQATIKKAGPI